MKFEGERKVGWMLAEYESIDALVRAARRMRDLGYLRLDAYSPYPNLELERALAIPRSKLPRYVLAAGVVGVLFGFGLQWYLNGFDYALNVGGRPLLSAPAFIPITFETTILFSALAAFVVFFVLTRLPRLSHPILDADGFESASIDRFWLSIETSDAHYEPTSTHEALAESGALRVVIKEGVQ